MFSDFAKGRVEKRTLRLRTRELQAPRCREDCTEIALEHARRACRPGAASWRDGSGRQVHLPRAVWTAARYGAAHASVRELRTWICDRRRETLRPYRRRGGLSRTCICVPYGDRRGRAEAHTQRDQPGADIHLKHIAPRTERSVAPFRCAVSSRWSTRSTTRM